ncbi:efflux RND transporter periplasmic adaptor subunit [Mangrovimonas aestuarii]|uniref:efflux RND transporter periplasmic adaptor subunit n=1 Tax=Mangrovimonas aestuarii TaxID=3018443 RepID=UPI002379F11C|nr:efflux RND transporter periplasmic adaptor subunit [Mangrovimonas aestuarii]
MIRIKQLTIAVLMIALATSCGKDKEPKTMIDTPAVEVEVGKVQSNKSNAFIAASGKVEATNHATLSTRMMGFVEQLPAKVGEKVQKGELLVVINNSDLVAKRAQVNAGISEAEAAFKNAEKDYNRFKNLFLEQSATQKELDDITARYEMAQARLESAREMKKEVEAQFAYSNIRAPFGGVVTNTFVEKGDLANPGRPLVALESSGKGFEIQASIPESEIASVKLGDSVSVTITSTGTDLKGTISEVSTSAQHTGGQFLVKVALDSSGKNLMSGMYATVKIPVEKVSNQTAVLIPTSALVNKGQLNGVYTVSEKGTAILRWLRLGRTYGKQVEVLSGLGLNETYIVNAQGKLYNGVKVNVQQ